jgi:NADP-dependent 3-hydroxy acid dehydrogenase YdfG
MTHSEQIGATALVTRASRGFGRAIAAALHAEGSRVVAVARNAELLASLRDELGGTLNTVVADVADPVIAGTLIEQYRPDTLVLNAGAAPLLRPLQQLTWEAFSRTWEVDVKQAFHWIREALLLPLRPGSTVLAMSSGAAVAGSPLSGGYAGAKATIRFDHGLRRRRVSACRARQPVHLPAAEADTSHRARVGRGRRIRAARRARGRRVP